MSFEQIAVKKAGNAGIPMLAVNTHGRHFSQVGFPEPPGLSAWLVFPRSKTYNQNGKVMSSHIGACSRCIVSEQQGPHLLVSESTLGVPLCKLAVGLSTV
jgi:hypothetical protein